MNRDSRMFKLDLEKAEEPEIKLPTSVGSWKKQESARKTSTSTLLIMLKPLTMWITTSWKILQLMAALDHLTCLLRNLNAGQEASKVALYTHLLKHLPQFVVIHIVKGFSIVNKSEVNVLLEFSCFFYDPEHVGNLISGSSAFSKSSLNVWKFLVHVLLNPRLENFQHYFASM